MKTQVSAESLFSECSRTCLPRGVPIQGRVAPMRCIFLVLVLCWTMLFPVQAQWSEEAKLTASVPVADADFGFGVAIQQGTTALV